MKGFVKDPGAILDYSIDWGPWLDGDTISTSSWIVESPLIVPSGSESFTSTVTTLFLSGGDAGSNYVVTNQVTTVGNRTDERSIEIRVRNR
jgi:hypothetical protein